MGTTFKPTLFPHGTLMYLFDGYLPAGTPRIRLCDIIIRVQW